MCIKNSYRSYNYLLRIIISNCMATYFLSLKQSKLDKQDVWDTAREVTFSYGPLYMDVPVLADQQLFIDLPGAMADRDECRETIRKIHANTQYYKVCIKSKVEKSREKSSALPYTSVY